MPTTPTYGLRYQSTSDTPSGATLGQNLATDVEDELTRIDAAIAALRPDANEAGVAAAAVTSGTDTTTSASYVNMAGTGSVTSFSFTKAQTATRVRLDLLMSLFSTAINTHAFIGMRINSVDYDVDSFDINPASTHVKAGGFAYIAASVVPAGTYTVQARWKRTAGAGTLTRDTNDWLAISAREI